MHCLGNSILLAFKPPRFQRLDQRLIDCIIACANASAFNVLNSKLRPAIRSIHEPFSDSIHVVRCRSSLQSELGRGTEWILNPFEILNHIYSGAVNSLIRRIKA